MTQKGIVDPNLEGLLRHLAEQKAAASQARTTNTAIPWMRPPLGDWDGDLQTVAGLRAMHQSFQTEEAENALIEAFDPEQPGNSADGIVLSLQIDYAAQAERAYRARTSQTFPRTVAHQAAREKGHGQPTGALLGQALDYFNHLLKQGADASGGSA